MEGETVIFEIKIMTYDDSGKKHYAAEIGMEMEPYDTEAVSAGSIDELLILIPDAVKRMMKRAK